MEKIIAIVGPTGVGKTRLGIELAKEFKGEVISCDSMQFYKGLDIGTAKVTKSEMEGIKHHLIDILEPNESFSVAEYQKLVRNKINELQDKKITPILVGGSGLFINSVLYDYQFTDGKRDDELLKKYESNTLEELVEILREKSPNIALNTPLENKRRVLRALEKTEAGFTMTGDKLFYEDAIIIGLETDRELLYNRINKRVDLMLEHGLLEEAKWLYTQFLDTQVTKAIGYKEFYHYFEGKNDLDVAIELLKRNSRRFAKRQMTWFKNKMNCNWIYVDFDDFEKTIQKTISLIKNKKTKN